MAFIEAFARINIEVIKGRLAEVEVAARAEEEALDPDWDSPESLTDCGLRPDMVNQEVREGRRYLHIDVAASGGGAAARALFLDYTGLSEKQQRALFPIIVSNPPYANRAGLVREVQRLNAWQDWVRQRGFDPVVFTAYRSNLNIHGGTQNLSGAIGVVGAAIAFLDAIRETDPAAIVGSVGDMPPEGIRSPEQIHRWRLQGGRFLKTLLLANGRTLIFSGSKDVSIVQPLDNPFRNAAEALRRFNRVKDDDDERDQQFKEFAVGEIKTATDLANLHERIGLASRETKTELRKDRFLMMSILSREILDGGRQRRRMNNNDLTRFSHVFNLHHCWGWDGGRERHPDHWAFFVTQVRRWCGL